MWRDVDCVLTIKGMGLCDTIAHTTSTQKGFRSSLERRPFVLQAASGEGQALRQAPRDSFGDEVCQCLRAREELVHAVLVLLLERVQHSGCIGRRPYFRPHSDLTTPNGAWGRWGGGCGVGKKRKQRLMRNGEVATTGTGQRRP